MHTYTHTYIQTYIHTYTLTYMTTCTSGTALTDKTLHIRTIIDRHTTHKQHSKELFANIIDHHHRLAERVKGDGLTWESAISSDAASLDKYADAGE